MNRQRDRDPASPPSKRNSITDRIRTSFSQARRDTSASIQRRTSSASTNAPKQSPVLRIREWLDTCNADHHHHCSPSSAPADQREIPTWRPVWLIDTVERCLVRAKPTDRYATLSYVWGNGQGSSRRPSPEATVQLLKTNLDAFQLGLPETDVPQTILDAIWLAKKLGMRHIWIDRLCIVHDDEDERETYVRNMGFVFANSYITIVAAFGDVTTGLLPLDTRRAARRTTRTAADHVELLSESKWITRGWTLEEQIYSRRMVFFFEDSVTWQCHCEIWQGTATGMVKALRGGRHVCVDPVPPAMFGYRHPPWPDLDEFARIAAEYSSRRVTLVDDTLTAFAGISHILSRIYPGGFTYGMPLMFLDIALLWRPAASIRRRAVTRPPFLPSWSWMGWWFDGVPMDVGLWKASVDYIEDTKYGRKGQASLRFQSTTGFRIRPVVAWNLTDRQSMLPVPNTGLQHREFRSRKAQTASLPPGWLRAGSYFKHDSDDSTLFRYPIPVEDPPEMGEYSAPPGDLAFPGPFLSFKTTHGFFDVDYGITMSPKGRPNPPIAVGNIWTRSNRWAGEFRAHDGWLGVQSSNYTGEERLEFIAISTAAERRGSQVFPEERFDEFKDADGILELVNVLWVERISTICYRRGIGHVLLKAWEAQAKEEVDILLG